MKPKFNNNKLEIRLAEQEEMRKNRNESIGVNKKRNVSNVKDKIEVAKPIKQNIIAPTVKPVTRTNSVSKANLKQVKLEADENLNNIMNLKKNLTSNKSSSKPNNIVYNNNLNEMFIGNTNKNNISPNKNLPGIEKHSSIGYKPKIMNSNNFNNNNNYADNKNSHTKLSVNSNFKIKPSDKFSKKSSDPFASGDRKKSNFVYVYQAGGIPCKIVHGSVRLKLHWDIPPDKLEYDPILLVCFEGLMETEHPYNFASRECVRQLLLADDSYEKVVPLLDKIIPALRKAISTNDKDAFIDSLEITVILSDLVKEALNPYLHLILQPINKRCFEVKYKEKIFDVFRALEINGGEDAYKEMKKKIPTYVSSL